MKKLIVLAATAVLLTSISVSTFAKSVEDKCKAQAEKHKIAADKMDDYVKTCVEKHMKHHKKAASTTPAPAPAPAAAPAAPMTPAEPGK
jgi:hypothetical protein